jgi:flagellin
LGKDAQASAFGHNEKGDFVMPLVINTNVASMNAQRNLSYNTSALGRVLERLASGYKINRAGDDAAGLQISESLRAQIRGSKKALDNVQDGLSVLSISDGVQGVIQENLQRIRELTVQAANDTNATAQRDAIALEINARRTDIDRIANSASFNGVTLMAAGSSNPTSFNLQVGPNSNVNNDVIDIISAIGDTTTGTSGLDLATAAFASNASALAYLDQVDTALIRLNSKRATLGSFQNRLESAAANLTISIENLTNAESRIRNADVAAEAAELTRYQILQQAAASVLRQANQTPQLALSLLNGG